MTVRKATAADIAAVSAIFEDIHTEEESGRVTIGWIRGVYPTRATADSALARDDLFVLEEDGKVLGTAVINQIQVDSYADGAWRYAAPEEEVMVLHTLVISPKAARRGCGRTFVDFYERYALENGCRFLRMDTNARNLGARAMYQKLGYAEVDTVPCEFNGIPGVQLVLLEKYLG